MSTSSVGRVAGWVRRIGSRVESPGKWGWGHALALAAFLAVTLGSAHARAESCVTSLNCKDPHRPICGLDLQCHACTNNTECTVINVQTSVCLGADAGASAGECTQPCVVDGGNCSGPTPVCSGGLVCVGCSTDHGGGTLACPDPNKPACQDDLLGLIEGTCTQCNSRTSSVCQTSADTPACDVSSGECGCNTDSDCGKGRYCDRTTFPDGGAAGDAGATSGVCQIGCRTTTDAGPNGNCPTGKTCNAADGGTIGVCQGTGCNGDGDCTTAPFTKCDTANTHECVQCTQDSDCSGGKVCETDTTNPSYGLCVDCTQTKTQNCTTAGDGLLCIASSDTCGCGSDTDCGDKKSGRVCGGTATAHKCIPGCRGTGGNGCPDPEVCSSTDDTIGTCSNGNGDGGAGDGGSGDGGSLDGSSADGDTGNGNGVSLDGMVQGGGCSCTIGGSDATPLLGLGVGVAALGAAFARRRRRRK